MTLAGTSGTRSARKQRTGDKRVYVTGPHMLGQVLRFQHLYSSIFQPKPYAVGVFKATSNVGSVDP